MEDFHLLPPNRLNSLFCWSNRSKYDACRFLNDVMTVAAALPEGKYLLNECKDRYQFMVTFAAAMNRKKITLFPSNKAPEIIENLSREYKGLYLVLDRATDIEGLSQVKYEQLISQETDKPGSNPYIDPEQVVAMAFTSGTTGEPKRYRKTWGWFVREAQGAGQHLEVDGLSQVYMVATVPPQHMYGFIVSVMLPLRFNLAVFSGQPFFPDDIRTVLEKSPGPVLLVSNPAQLRACISDKTALSNLAGILSSAAPLELSLAKQLEKTYQTRVFEFYGSTETGAMASRRTCLTDHWRTFPEVEVEESAGGLLVKSDYFLDDIQLSDSVDVINKHEFRLHGRHEDMVKIGGKRASIVELTQSLLAVEGVSDGVFFSPDSKDKKEQRVVAFVVAPGLQSAELMASLKRRIDRVFLPRPLRLVDSLPRTASGKLPKAKLQELYLSFKG